jgi:hypothetical protein
MSDYNTKVHGVIGGDQQVFEVGSKLLLGSVTITIDASGNAIATGLPTADPHVAGALWNSSGALTVSAG